MQRTSNVPRSMRNPFLCVICILTLSKKLLQETECMFLRYCKYFGGNYSGSGPRRNLSQMTYAELRDTINTSCGMLSSLFVTIVLVDMI